MYYFKEGNVRYYDTNINYFEFCEQYTLLLKYLVLTYNA